MRISFDDYVEFYTRFSYNLNDIPWLDTRNEKKGIEKITSFYDEMIHKRYACATKVNLHQVRFESEWTPCILLTTTYAISDRTAYQHMIATDFEHPIRLRLKKILSLSSLVVERYEYSGSLIQLLQPIG